MPKAALYLGILLQKMHVIALGVSIRFWRAGNE